MAMIRRCRLIGEDIFWFRSPSNSGRAVRIGCTTAFFIRARRKAGNWNGCRRKSLPLDLSPLIYCFMVQSDISRPALDLPPEDRLELARLLVESVASPADLDERIKEGIQRIEHIATGNVQGLTEEQFNAMLRK